LISSVGLLKHDRPTEAAFACIEASQLMFLCLVHLVSLVYLVDEVYLVYLVCPVSLARAIR
jgi:hypothetical protein